MKILVFSDSHGNEDFLNEAIRQNLIDLNLIIYCGDGVDDIENVANNYPNIPIEIVAGNREEYLHGAFSYKQLQLESIIQFADKSILITHGHKYNVKFSEYPLSKYAMSKNIDIVLYGHTHIASYNIIPYADSNKVLHIMNPGSIGSSNPTYGIIKISDSKIDIHILTV